MTLAAERVATEAAPYDADGRAHAPTLPSYAVHRTALVNRLRSSGAAVIVVAAPAGYGKTTLIAQWAARDQRRFAWTRIEEGDSIVRLVEAFGRELGVEGLPEELGRSVSLPALVRVIGRRLPADAEPIVFVLDEADALHDESAFELLHALVDYLPRGSQLVLSGRGAPKFGLGRLRAEGRLLELETADLRMSEREARDLLRRMDVELEEADLADLCERAEGWPVGLAICGLALRRSNTRRGRTAVGIGGAHHFISEYLMDEVLQPLPTELLSFAVEASILDRMSGPACDDVLDRTGSADRLRQLGSGAIFLIPLDREHTRFRFHRFFREMLLTRLEHDQPERFSDLSGRAASWYERAGDTQAAIEHLRSIHDRDHAAGLLGTLALQVCTRGAMPDEATLDDICDELLLADHPAAAVTGALVHAMEGRAAKAARWAIAADRAQELGPMPDGADSSRAWVSLMRAALCRDGVTPMLADAHAALEQLPARSPLVPFALMLCGIAHNLSGDWTAAEAELTEASELAAGEAAPLVAAVALAELSLMSQEAGDWDRAEELARQARDTALSLDNQEHAFATLAYAASARSALRHSNWVRAGDDLEKLHELLPRANGAIGWLAALARIEASRAHLALNDLAAADELATELQHLLLAQPHLERAEVELVRIEEQIDGQREVPREASTLTAAELRLLPLLTTHLTFRQIAQRLYVSRNTIKTQAISVYRKLGVTSRAEAIDRAVELGLLKRDGDSLGRAG